MKVKVYSTSKDDTYLVLPIDSSRVSIPLDLLASLGEIYFLKNSDLATAFAWKDNNIAESIAEKGYSIYEPKVSVR